MNQFSNNYAVDSLVAFTGTHDGKAARLILGTAGLAKPYAGLQPPSRKDAQALILAAMRDGAAMIDTAPSYGTEELIGSVAARIAVCTKLAPGPRAIKAGRRAPGAAPVTSINSKMGLKPAGKRNMMKLPADRALANKVTAAKCPSCGSRGARLLPQRRLFCSWCSASWDLDA